MSFLKGLFGKNKSKVSTKQLRKVNIVAALLYFAQAVAVLVLSETGKGAVSISTSFLGRDSLATQTSGQEVMSQAHALLFDINLSYIVAGFLFLGALVHLLLATRLQKRYESQLKLGFNKLRWFEYAVSFSAVVIVVALVSGIFDLGTLLALSGLVALTSLTGLYTELVNKKGFKKPDMLSFKLGRLAGLVTWLVLAITLVSGAVNTDGGIPAYVYAIFASTAVLFIATFAVNQLMYLKQKGAWADYYFVERKYVILSFLLKSALAWQVFAGLLR